MNKKTLLTLLLFPFASLLMHSQEKEQKTVFLTAPSRNELLIKDPLWSLSIGTGVQTYFGEDDNKVGFGKRLTFAPTISLSRRLSNLFTARLQLTGGSLHGYNDGVSGSYALWHTEKIDNPGMASFDPTWDYMGWTQGPIGQGNYDLWPDGHGTLVYAANWNENGGYYVQHLRYIGAHGDLMLNLLNLIEGAKPGRSIEVYPFVGVAAFQRFAHRGTLSNTYFGGSAGLQVSGRLTDKFSIYGEVRGTIVNDEFDGQRGDMSSNGIGSATVGLSYHFGQPKYIDPDVETRLNLPYNIAKAKDGMVLVPGGNIEMGLGVDPVWGDTLPKKLVAVSPFWMDETEVTNRQYREFVYWVRDSIIRERLADPAYGGDPTFKVPTRDNRFVINWNKPIPWKNPTDREAMTIASVVSGDSFDSDKTGMRSTALNYKYEWFDSKSYYGFLVELDKGTSDAIMVSKDTAYVDATGQIVRETITRESYGDLIDFTNTYIVNVYPDVFVWMTDFANAKNEQYMNNYYTSPTFDNFPVVGVTWEQADAYCAWRTDRFRSKNKGKTDGFEVYRLPTEAEFEFAARSGRSEFSYSWFSNEIHTKNGLAQGNFRSSADLKDLLSPVATFMPNRFGLYDMSGNVAEWTNTTYTESADLLSDGINPDYSFRAVNSDPDILKRKVVKGGSWKDAGDYTKSGSRTFEQQNKGRSYIGFRCVRSWGLDQKGKLK